MPKLASEQAGTKEETKGAALASQQEVLFVFVKDRVYELSSPNTGSALCMEKRQVLKAVDAGGQCVKIDFAA